MTVNSNTDIFVQVNVDATGANYTFTSLVGSSVTVGSLKPIGADGSFKVSVTVGSSAELVLNGTFVSATKATGTWSLADKTGTWEANPRP